MPREYFHLQAPPDFRGFSPDLQVNIYKRNLPHWRQEGATYFVTFRLADSLPKEKLRFIKSMRLHWEAKYPPPRTEEAWEEYARTVFVSVEKWLDQGSGACLFQDKKFADELARSILCYQRQRYFVGCFVVMPNHCHLVIRPIEGFRLEGIVGTIKGVVARFVNDATGSSGPVWQSECFDRIVRDEEHLFRVVQYIGRNPKKAGLPEASWRRWVCPQWQACGWGFRDGQ